MNLAIALVLDPAFGDSVPALAERMATWTISSEENDRSVAKARAALAPIADITSIVRRAGESTADLFLRALYEIDEHHGLDSDRAPYDRVVVVGGSPALVSAAVRDELGFNKISTAPTGFALEKERAPAPSIAPTGTCP